MRKLWEFVQDAGAWGLASVLAALVSSVILVWEHMAGNSPLPEFWILALLVVLFWLGAYKAWEKKAVELEAFKDAAKRPHVKGKVLLGYIDATKFVPTSGQLQDLAQGSYVSLLVEAVNQNECPAHFTAGPKLRFTLYGEAYEGTFESCPSQLELSIDDPSYPYPEHRMVDFFRNVFMRMPMERGIPHNGWLRFYICNLNASLLFGKVDIQAEKIRVTFADTLDGHHILHAEALTMPVGHIKLTSETLKQP